MNFAYEAPDYSSGSLSRPKEPEKTKTVYPTLELRGECALKFMAGYPDITLGETLKGPVALKVCGMKRSEQVSGYNSDYDNCVTFELISFTSKSEEPGEPVTMEDYNKAKKETSGEIPTEEQAY